MDLSVFFVGTGGSVPTPRRGLPALLVRRGGDRLLFDCGEGSQRQLPRSGGVLDLEAGILTHFPPDRPDYGLGLPGLLKSCDLRGREHPLPIYGPRGIRELLLLALKLVGKT